LRFFNCSGAFGGTPSTRATPNLEIFNLEPGATASPERLGFFGLLGAPNGPVIVGTYQERTHRTDHNGTDLGTFMNVKFTGASSAEVSGVPLTLTGHTLATIPQASGTLLVRFTEPSGTQVQTQNAFIRAIALTEASGALISTTPSNITIQAAQLADTHGNAGDSSWSDLTGGSNQLDLANQAGTALVHDYHLILSASPLTAGVNRSWGFYVQLEFLNILFAAGLSFLSYFS